MKMQVRDIELEVEVDVDRDGRGAYFVAMYGFQRYSSRTWEGLYKTLMAQTKREKVRVRVPYWSLTREGFVSHVAVGIHAGTGNVEREGRDGKPEQIDNFAWTSMAFGEMTELERAQRLNMQDQQIAIEAAIKEFDDVHTFRLKDVVSAAIEKVVADDQKEEA